jgi:hypothetical protein
MKKATYSDVLKLLQEHDSEAPNTPLIQPISPELLATLSSYFEDDREHVRPVLGIDIYRYSRYEPQKQRLIPIIFRFLYEETLRCLTGLEKLFSPSVRVSSLFISTGDGGFQMLETPLHGIVFAVWFQVVLSAYNAGFHFPMVRHFVGPLTVRYGLTFDSVFRLDSNIFGPAIINNARIISRDSLNRFLVDGATIDWFVERIGTLETLTVLPNRDLARVPELGRHVKHRGQETLLFQFKGLEDLKSAHPPAFRTVIVQKIGSLTAKATELDVYSLYLQVNLSRFPDDPDYKKDLVITVGNLNSSGLES